MRMGPGKHLRGLTLMDGIVAPEEFNYFHKLVCQQEITRMGTRGYGDGLNAGAVIRLLPVLNFDTAELKAHVVPEVLQGRKFICLTISEAFAGSDVMRLQTTAVKMEDGKHWIMNGTFCDYFTIGCKSEDGFTIMLDKRSEGLKTIKMSYSPSTSTAFVTFDNMKVAQRKAFGKPLASRHALR
ncbi:acyl-CoA dehydrogenase/oxidase [Vararia minispora EC-137]|uniref:Acyl-CoA dehydrogenase/oxidase n=1 Tax=Vararia minispora EC-137 TaxID=1314806 RepID=A0ACB8Q5W1_9AGAM|nr:acyl-CoA dehydrogenase/oxidase [Vararia minispora EC-137]